MAKKKYVAYAKRFCTYCGKTEMYYCTTEDGPIGVCSCGNTDWCDNMTEDDIKAQIGKGRLIACDVDIIFED